MFYAASEIVFWILLAAIIGGGIGYGLSEAKSVRIGKRLSQSRADAPMERELAIAWDTIEDLNRRLQVAHETIRGGGGPSMLADLEAQLDDEHKLEDEGGDYIEVEAATGDIDEIGARTPDAVEDEPTGDATPENNGPRDGDEFTAPLVHTVEQVVPAEGDDEVEAEDAADGVVGSRLADRVASASIGNQVEVVKTVEF